MTDGSSLHSQRYHNPQIGDNTVVYAYFLSWPTNGILTLGAPKGTSQTKVSMFGYSGSINFKVNPTGGIVFDLTKIMWNQLPNPWSWVLKLENLADDNHEPKIIYQKNILRGQ